MLFRSEYKNGNKYWYIDGKLHRLDGPAEEYRDGDKEWCKEWHIDGKYYSFKKYLNHKDVSKEYKTDIYLNLNDYRRWLDE